MVHVLTGYMIDGRTSGIDKYLLGVLDTMKDAPVCFDFLTNRRDPGLEQILKAYHAELIEIPSLKHPVRQYRMLVRLIRERKYDMAYFNISESFNCTGVLAAKHCGLKKIVVHSHNSAAGGSSRTVRAARTVLNELMKGILGRNATDYYACSQKAGQWLFSARVRTSPGYHVLYNGIHIQDYRFCPEVRCSVRRELGLENRLVIGHVGSYCYAKNNLFLIDIMKELIKLRPEAVMLAAGEGPDWEDARNRAVSEGVGGHILFLGPRSDVPALLQAMDVFVLPSRFEGQPIAAIEAQIAGLKVLLSDTISREAALSEYCMWESIRSPASVWAERIAAACPYERLTVNDKKMSVDAYDINRQAEQIRGIFCVQAEERTGDHEK